MIINWKKIEEHFPVLLLCLYLGEMLILAISPYDRPTWWAENLPVMMVVIILVITYRYFRFSNRSYFLMALFLMYHTIGGHFTFEHTPFIWGNKLLAAVDGHFLFPEGRNNFDRLGHFLVGVFALPIAEFFYRRRLVVKWWAALLVGVLAIGFWAALYEIIEMIYALQSGGEAGQLFLGAQGDIWDAQKDMLLDILGALTTVLLFGFASKPRWTKKDKELLRKNGKRVLGQY